MYEDFIPGMYVGDGHYRDSVSACSVDPPFEAGISPLVGVRTVAEEAASLSRNEEGVLAATSTHVWMGRHTVATKSVCTVSSKMLQNISRGPPTLQRGAPLPLSVPDTRPEGAVICNISTLDNGDRREQTAAPFVLIPHLFKSLGDE